MIKIWLIFYSYVIVFNKIKKKAFWLVQSVMGFILIILLLCEILFNWSDPANPYLHLINVIAFWTKGSNSSINFLRTPSSKLLGQAGREPPGFYAGDESPLFSTVKIIRCWHQERAIQPSPKFWRRDTTNIYIIRIRNGLDISILT